MWLWYTANSIDDVVPMVSANNLTMNGWIAQTIHTK